MSFEVTSFPALSPETLSPTRPQVSNDRLADKVDFVEELNRILMDSSGDCVLILDEDGHVQSLNRFARELLEIPPGRDCSRLQWTTFFPELETRGFPLALRAENLPTFQASSRTSSGTFKYWSFKFSSLGSITGRGRRFLLVARDISHHAKVENALRQSEEAFRKIFEENPIGILLANLDFRVIKVNDALGAMLGFAREELIGREMRLLSAEFSDPVYKRNYSRLLQGELSSFDCETMLQLKRGGTLWTHITTSVVRHVENHPICLLQMIENIHSRKASEDQVLAYQEKLQFLASQVSLSEERERRRIATNLHDRIGQSLAFARIKLGSLSQQASSEPLNEIRDLIERVIADTRSITFELSPPVLYELGLVAALEWLTRRIQREHGIPTRFHDDGQPKPIDDDFRIVLFQAVRELLVNVVKHAGASHAQVLVRRDADALRIIIEDDGQGFSPAQLEADRHSGSSFGLFNIRERLDYLGGKLKIRSEPGRGTRVTLIAPLNLNPAEPAPA
jgi:PAS domain S-box-containing protein